MFLKSVEKVLAPFVAHLFLQPWGQCVQRNKPTPAPPFCPHKMILQIFHHPCDFPWQQGQQALIGEALAQALPPAASTTALSCTAHTQPGTSICSGNISVE